MSKLDNSVRVARKRIGFLGVGWIGRHRLESLAKGEMLEVAAIADPLPEAARKAAECAPHAELCGSLDELLQCGLDAVVIATPSALHAQQSISALQCGLAVFCQKPLGRSFAEAASVIDAARKADRLLAVDLSYRHLRGIQSIRGLIRSGEIGEVFSVNLVFHNAYGPDKPWFYEPEKSGGGCVIDLGIHLVDLALWTLDFPRVRRVSSRLFAKGKPLADRLESVEDYAAAQLTLESGAVVTLACSWHLSAGCDAVIEASFYGTAGTLSLMNVNGSFYDFQAELFRGTSRQVIAKPPDEWGGRAALEWAWQLAENSRFDPAVEQVAAVAAVLDEIYEHSALSIFEGEHVWQGNPGKPPIMT
ncbi:MAG: gfo/Idh/MocA family oxidoreductase [Candidatus Abyssobacteria bacterium SURF_5]|uniref:Gfo/Idh/MocA family oxidoreductase n=1 Tax=Abyssobacteria bacterium (strain SURF_5) TaxID=2093360 RepID=A0A3A4N714_ABYX5|nr:MAG: gfo/Idh/MocA family oxidoreductase [Candidatus Abyssubacteria bacterium SURF_5]